MGSSSSKRVNSRGSVDESLLSPVITTVDDNTNQAEEDLEKPSGCCFRSRKGDYRAVSQSDNIKEKEHSSFGRLIGLARPQWFTLTLAFIALIFSSAATLAQPLFFGKIIQTLSDDNEDEDSQTDEVNRYAFILVVILLVGGVSSMIRGWLFGLVGERLVRKLRTDLFAKIVNQDVAFFDANKTGELINRLASDTAVVQSSLSNNISLGLRTLASIVVSIFFLFVTSWKLTIVMMAVIPALMVVVAIYGRFTKKLTKEYQDALAAAADTGSESISNSRVMKSFGAEDWETKQYHLLITRAYQKGATKSLAYGSFVGGIGFLAGLAILVVVYYGATQVIHGDLNVGQLTSFILYTVYIALGLGIISSLYSDFMNAIGASERIFRIMDTEPGVPTKGGIWPVECKGNITFKDVDFCYPTRVDFPVLKQFNLVIQPNETVALVGSSGSGKTTVLSLLQRFYEVNTGDITIDGTSLKNIDPRWLHRNVVIVPQEPVLFSGTIYSNIVYSRLASNPETEGEAATMEEVERVGKQANAHDFIMSFPEGYHTIVGERGVRLSGGQKQRVAIARALLANPKVLLLDEATSALDSESEMLVQDAINRLMKDRTVIIIAHRLSTVRDADKIAVFDNGKIIDSGTHTELLEKSSTYSNLVRKQLDKPQDPVI